MSALPVVLKLVSNGPEADVMCGLLRANGIQCAHRPAMAVETMWAWTEILVAEADLERAAELLDPDE